MSKRDELVRVLCKRECGQEARQMCGDRRCEHWLDFLIIVDEFLSVLMEPGEGAKLFGARSIGKTMGYENHMERAKECLQAILTAIKEGK